MAPSRSKGFGYRRQGLRGSDLSVVWRLEKSLPHWKPATIRINNLKQMEN